MCSPSSSVLLCFGTNIGVIRQVASMFPIAGKKRNQGKSVSEISDHSLRAGASLELSKAWVLVELL